VLRHLLAFICVSFSVPKSLSLLLFHWNLFAIIRLALLPLLHSSLTSCHCKYVVLAPSLVPFLVLVLLVPPASSLSSPFPSLPSISYPMFESCSCSATTASSFFLSPPALGGECMNRKKILISTATISRCHHKRPNELSLLQSCFSSNLFVPQGQAPNFLNICL